MTVCDRKGRVYVDARNPSVGDRNRTRTYRDELTRDIQNNLDWLKGAQVSVQVSPPPSGPVAAAPSAPALPAPAPEAAPPPAEELVAPAPSMGVNQPLELTPEPEPEPEPAPAPRPQPAAPAPPPAAPAGIELSAPPRVRVWVKVPRSFYLRALPGREPSLEALQPLVERMNAAIQTAVKHVVPPDQLDEVVVTTIPDEAPARDAAALPEASVTRVDLAWWVPAAAGVATAAVLAVAFRLLAARRPAPRAAARGGDARGRYELDEASAPGPGPGPSERVRELIRLSPEAAASVLNRWTQGGTIG